MAVFLFLAFISIPLFSGCQSKQLQEENAALKSELESLNAKYTNLESKVAELTNENSALRSRTEGLTRERDGLTNRLADLIKQSEEKKAPKGKKKKK